MRQQPGPKIDFIDLHAQRARLEPGLSLAVQSVIASGFYIGGPKVQELEEKLAGSPLLRVHRSAFVRPDKVVEVKRANRSLSLVLVDGANVQVGPSYVNAVRAALALE